MRPPVLEEGLDTYTFEVQGKTFQTVAKGLAQAKRNALWQYARHMGEGPALIMFQAKKGLVKVKRITL